jgi:hypothetical protein
MPYQFSLSDIEESSENLPVTMLEFAYWNNSWTMLGWVQQAEKLLYSFYTEITLLRVLR